jgi:hypothetical protein
MIVDFNVHNVVRVRFHTIRGNRLLDSIEAYLREFKGEIEDNVDVFISDYHLHPHFSESEYVVVSEYSKPYLYINGYLDSPEERFCFNLLNRPLVLFCDNHCPLPLTFLLELILLERGYTFIHALGIQHDNRAFLFPALPGVGKTTLALNLLHLGLRDEYKLLGDDLVIINEREALAFPIDLAIYPYHLKVLREKNGEAMKKLRIIKLLDTLYESNLGKAIVLSTTRILERIGFSSFEIKRAISSIKESHVRVPLKNIFSANSIGGRGRIDKIYYLIKVHGTSLKPIVESISATKLAEICTHILLHEWSLFMPILTLYSGLSGFCLNSFFVKIHDIFRKIFAQHECYQVIIPSKLDTSTLLSLMKRLLS